MTCYITGKRYINLLCNICYNWLDYVLCNIWCYTVLGMSLRKVTSLGSNLASVTDLKGIETPHSLCCDFGGDKTFTTWTRWSGGIQVWVQVWAPACHLAISPKALPEENRRFRGRNHRPSSWGSSPALLARRTGEHKHRVFPSRWQSRSLRAATGSLDENILPLLQYWLRSRVNKVSMLCRYWGGTSHFLFSCEMKILMELARSCCRPKQRPLLCSIFQSVIGLWVKIWHRNKCSVSNPVQSSRSKSTTCPRKGRLLRFELDSCNQQPSDFRWRRAKAWKQCQEWFWIDLNLITTKVCSQIDCKWNAMLKAM